MFTSRRKPKKAERKSKGNKSEFDVLILDCNAICHAAKHGMRGLSHDEMETGVIFGFLNRLLLFQRTFSPRVLVFAWDSRKSKRKKMFPDYKKKRVTEKTPEDIELDNISYPQFNEIRRVVLPELGFKNNFICTGYEADDIIAEVVRHYIDSLNEPELDDDCDEEDWIDYYVHRDMYKTVIVTRDNDIFQLLDTYVSIFDPQTKKLLTNDWFEEKYDILSQQWSLVKAVAGCKTDEVPGIKGVGEKTAIKYINRELNKQSNLYKRIRSNRDIINRNYKLVTLPLGGIQVPDIKVGTEINLLGFNNVCTRYGFKSFLKTDKYNEWRKAFGEGG